MCIITSLLLDRLLLCFCSLVYLSPRSNDIVPLVYLISAVLFWILKNKLNIQLYTDYTAFSLSVCVLF